jgi:hypothetical protein
MQEPSPTAGRSRRRPPRRRNDEPIPIPEAPERSRQPKTVKLHEVLRAYQAAIVEVVDQRMAQVAESTSVRLMQIEEAINRLAEGSPAPAETEGNGELLARLEAVARAVGDLTAKHRALAEELSRRTGEGVMSVANVLRRDLQTLGQDVARLRDGVAALEEHMEGVQTSVRSMHRTLAWEGMRAGRAGADQAEAP